MKTPDTTPATSASLTINPALLIRRVTVRSDVRAGTNSSNRSGSQTTV